MIQAICFILIIYHLGNCNFVTAFMLMLLFPE